MQIVSHDSLFARALQITLAKAGLPRPDLTSILPQNAYFPLIVDLDDFDCPQSSLAVTFSSDPSKHADFTRPFLMSAFVDLCRTRFSLEMPTAPIASEQPLLFLTEQGVLLNGQPVSLTHSEAALLRLLYTHAGECVPKEEIDRLWRGNGNGNGNMTEVYIRYLRKKLDEPSGLRLIRTVRGKGYILCLPNTSR